MTKAQANLHRRAHHHDPEHAARLARFIETLRRQGRGRTLTRRLEEARKESTP